MISAAGYSEFRAVTARSLAGAFWHTVIASAALALLMGYWYEKCLYLWEFSWRMIAGTLEAGSVLPLGLGMVVFAIVGVLPAVIFVALVKKVWRLGSFYWAGGWVCKEYSDKFVRLTVHIGYVALLAGVLAWLSPWPVLSYLLTLVVWVWYLGRLEKLV